MPTIRSNPRAAPASARALAACVVAALPTVFEGVGAAEPRLVPFELPDGRWEQLTVPEGAVPYTPGRLVDATPLLVEDYGRTWTTFAYESAAGGYREPEVDEPLDAGTGLWIIQASGADVALNVEVVAPELSATVSPACSNDAGCIEVLLPEVDAPTAWHMLGSPSAEPLDVAGVRVLSDRPGTGCESGCDLAAANAAELTDAALYHYDSSAGTYVRSTDRGALRPLQAFWQGVYGQSELEGVSVTVLDPELSLADTIDVALRTDLTDSNYASMSVGDSWSAQLGGVLDGNRGLDAIDVTRALVSVDGLDAPSSTDIGFDDSARPTLIANPAEGSLRLRWFVDGVRVTYDDPRAAESFEAALPIDEIELAGTGAEVVDAGPASAGPVVPADASTGTVVTTEAGLVGSNPVFSTGSIEVHCPVADGGASVPVPGTRISLVRRFPYDGPVAAFSISALETAQTATGRFAYSLFRYGLDRSADRQAARLRDEIDEIRGTVCGEGVLDGIARRRIAGRLADLASPNRRPGVFTRVMGLFAKGFQLCRLGGAWRLYDIAQDAAAGETARMEATVYRPPFGSTSSSWVVDLKRSPPYEHVIVLDPELCPVAAPAGRWVGVDRQRNERLMADFDASLDLVMDGASGTGTFGETWREYPDAAYSATVNARATVVGVDFAVTEILSETQRPGYVWCRNIAASLVQSSVNGRSTLRGPLTSDNAGRSCGPSTLELEAVE